MGDKVDNILETSIAAVIGILMICSLVIPVGVDQIMSLTGDYAQWNPMLLLVITMVIIGLVIAIVRYFTTSINKR